MRPIESLTHQEAAELRGLAFELDDTLLDAGRLTQLACSALFLLFDSGLELYGVTGRPGGWANVLPRLFPVRAVIGENGALACVRRDERVLTLDSISEPVRRERTARLDELVADLQRRFPELELSDDIAQRVSDRTFDIG